MHRPTVYHVTATLSLKEQTYLTFVVGMIKGSLILEKPFDFLSESNGLLVS